MRLSYEFLSPELKLDRQVARAAVTQERVLRDDGTGGEWEQSTGLSKKAQKRKEKQEQIKKEQGFQRLRCQAVAPTSWSVDVSFDVSCTVSCTVSCMVS
eukprot:s129_g19.t1